MENNNFNVLISYNLKKNTTFKFTYYKYRIEKRSIVIKDNIVVKIMKNNFVINLEE